MSIDFIIIYFVYMMLSNIHQFTDEFIIKGIVKKVDLRFAEKSLILDKKNGFRELLI